MPHDQSGSAQISAKSPIVLVLFTTYGPGMDRKRLQFDVKLALWRNRKWIPKSGAIDDFALYARRVIESLERSLTFAPKAPAKPHGTPAPKDSDGDGPDRIV